MINVISFRDYVSMYNNARSYVADDVITWLDRFGNKNFLSPGNDLYVQFLYLQLSKGMTWAQFGIIRVRMQYDVKCCHSRIPPNSIIYQVNNQL